MIIAGTFIYFLSTPPQNYLQLYEYIILSNSLRGAQLCCATIMIFSSANCIDVSI
jgi:hypothetical protein